MLRNSRRVESRELRVESQSVLRKADRASFPRSAWKREFSTLCVACDAAGTQSGQPNRSRVADPPRRAERANEAWFGNELRIFSRRRSERRGVLLLVVLSVLVLFMLVGTAFLITSKQTKINADLMSQVDRTGNNPTQLGGRAVLQVIGDTENTNSVIRGQSLLRDLYGGDGFEAVVDHAEYAGASVVPGPNGTGVTLGQFIDIYMATDASGVPAAVKIDRDPLGQKTPYVLSAMRGYYNGQLLTITKGAAAGQTTRIVDYEVDPASNQWRFRVMAFPRADGAALRPPRTGNWRTWRFLRPSMPRSWSTGGPSTAPGRDSTHFGAGPAGSAEPAAAERGRSVLDGQQRTRRGGSGAVAERRISQSGECCSARTRGA